MFVHTPVCNVYCKLQYIPSKENIADAPSRDNIGELDKDTKHIRCIPADLSIDSQ